jgi:hypothetical protein
MSSLLHSNISLFKLLLDQWGHMHPTHRPHRSNSDFEKWENERRICITYVDCSEGFTTPSTTLERKKIKE